MRRFWLLATLLALARPAPAELWNVTWDGALYGHLDSLQLRGGSLLNPGNKIAGLSKEDRVAEGRFNLKVESDDLRLTLRPILVQRSNPSEGQRQREAYLSQGQLRLRLNDAWALTAGREVLNWGPAQFRSPSSPFYFDNGRSNPLRELSGVDVWTLAWTPNRANSLTLAYIIGAGHDARGLSGSWLLKADRRDEAWAGGLILEQTPGQGLFLGAHARYTFSDALLVYAEAASSTRANALQSPADPGRPFDLASRSPRHATTLVGAAYTFENGQTFNAELLHDGHGYTAGQEQAYFDRAAASPALAGQALGHAPPLIGRDYVHLVWQSNLMETSGYWRLMASHSLTDHGTEVAGYGEYALNGHTSLFGQAALPVGTARQESSSLIRASLMVGVRVALP